MDLQEAIKYGGSIALVCFAGFLFLTLDFSAEPGPATVQNVEKTTRFLYAGVMTFAPTSQIAIFIDFGSIILASFGFLKGAKDSVTGGVVIAAFLYFFLSFLGNYLAAPI